LPTQQRLYEALYFSVQRLRHGVSRDMIAEACTLLEAPMHRLRARALERIRAVHGGTITWDSYRAMPRLQKATLAERAHAILQARHFGFEVRQTSGSTGIPLRLPKDRAMTAWMDAAMWGIYQWHGIHPGLPHVRFWGLTTRRLKRLGVLTADRLLNRHRVSASSLSSSSVIRDFSAIERLQPTYAYGYPTLMASFAQVAQENGLDGRALGLRVAISTGELLADSVRKQLADFFGCPVINEYGCTESGILAFECASGTMHAIPVAVWPEVVDADGMPVPDGEEGEILITDLYGGTLPLIRYSLRDRGVTGIADCPCGRELPVLKITAGRVDSFVLTPRGKVYDAVLAYSLPPGITRFRARQVAPELIEAQVVLGPGYVSGRTVNALKSRWENALGPGVSVRVTVVDEIPPEASGKLRYFVPLNEHLHSGADDHVLGH
jgi:phenylacetate-CoA ligase